MSNKEKRAQNFFLILFTLRSFIIFGRDSLCNAHINTHRESGAQAQFADIKLSIIYIFFFVNVKQKLRKNKQKL